MAVTVTNGRIDMPLDLPVETGLYIIGGGLSIFILVTYLLIKYNK
jgi:hypothetical protein